MTIQCILFDLDGTLLDTALDFAYALERTCQQFTAAPVDYPSLRAIVSDGSEAMVKLAFPSVSPDEFALRQAAFLNHYAENIAHHSQLFVGLELGLQHLAEQNIPWGIVTNKPGWLTQALMQKLTFPSAPKSVISGDSLAQQKPQPEPLWLAAEQCGINPQHCLYIGDHPRDLAAGKNAGMATGLARYGYLPLNPAATANTEWQADYNFNTPKDLSNFITTLTMHQP